MAKKTEPGLKVVARNRKAYHDYSIEDTIEAGLVLIGSEIKSIRDGRVNLRGSYAIIDIKPGQKMDKKLAVSDMEMMVNPREEWRQIFNDAWRLERDFFYDPDMHGVDWDAMKTRYGALIDDAVNRDDVNFILGELIGELNASHTYRGGGDAERSDRKNRLCVAACHQDHPPARGHQLNRQIKIRFATRFPKHVHTFGSLFLDCLRD